MTNRTFSHSRRALVAAFITLLIGGFAAGCATGQTGGSADASTGAEAVQEASAKVVLGVRKPKHVKVAMLTATQMLTGEGSYEAERVDIVACGPAIRALAGDSKLADQIDRSLKQGIRIKACGLTVQKMGFDRERFIDGVEVVPNGLTEIVRLQAEGFHSVEL